MSSGRDRARTRPRSLVDARDIWLCPPHRAKAFCLAPIQKQLCWPFANSDMTRLPPMCLCCITIIIWASWKGTQKCQPDSQPRWTIMLPRKGQHRSIIPHVQACHEASMCIRPCRARAHVICGPLTLCESTLSCQMQENGRVFHSCK